MFNSNGPLAQLVEQLTLNQLVRSSSLRRVIFYLSEWGIVNGEWYDVSRDHPRSAYHNHQQLGNSLANKFTQWTQI